MSAIGFVKAIHSVETRQGGVAKGGSNNAGLSTFKVYVAWQGRLLVFAVDNNYYCHTDTEFYSSSILLLFDLMWSTLHLCGISIYNWYRT